LLKYLNGPTPTLLSSPATSIIMSDNGKTPPQVPDATCDTSSTRHLKAVRLDGAVEGIGMGKYQWMLFAFTGFGLFIDNLWLVVTTLIFVFGGIAQVQDGFSIEGRFLELALTISLLVIISFETGFTDIRGQSIIITGVGGNLPRDLAILLDLVPVTYRWPQTALSSWCAFGQLFGNLVAFWLILFSPFKGQGWKYFLGTTIGLKLTLYTFRSLFPLYESPKYLLECRRDAEAIEALDKVAAYNGSSNNLTLKMLGRAGSAGGGRGADLPRLAHMRDLKLLERAHLQPLFDLSNFALSTSLLIILWALTGSIDLPAVKLTL